MRAIDADVLRESVLKWLPHDPCGVAENEHPYETDICVSMLMEIEEAQTIEPEQKTGKWKEHKDYPGLAYLCSKCGYFTTDRSYFCPNCGAKMEVQHEQTD